MIHIPDGLECVAIDALIPYVNNARQHSDEQVAQIAASIKQLGFNAPVLIDKDNGIIAGHGRVKAARKLGMDEVPVVRLDHLDDIGRRAYILADNRIAENSEWDWELVRLELEALDAEDFDLTITGFELDDLLDEDGEEEQQQTAQDDIPEPLLQTVTRPGDIWTLGNHRLMCGDSCSVDDVDRLMDGGKAELCFTDPPYGMGKASAGVANDNQNNDELLDFNRQWIPLSFDALTDKGSWYCWGIDEPLMDIYSNILRPMINEKQIAFRNLITWDKMSAIGVNWEGANMYPPTCEKCLFVVKGGEYGTGFSITKDDYNPEMEKVRLYLVNEFEKLGISKRQLVEAMGVTTITHWFSQSQFGIPTAEQYERLRQYGRQLLKDRQQAADFLDKDYELFRRDYDEIRRGYDKIKQEFYDGRAYFDNTHDKDGHMTDVWRFATASSKEREMTGGHATPKPLAVCQRAIKSSTKEGWKVLDLFGGSGSTLIACEQLGRQCRMMELQEKYCDVIIRRWQRESGGQAVRDDGVTFNSLIE